MSPVPRRPALSEREKIIVWALSAGRCTFCNRLVAENDVLGEAVLIGELAHNVGWGTSSPRGDSDLPDDQRQIASNLLLLCRNCHKPIDDGGVISRYTVEELAKRKREHEGRIRFLTGIGADRAATVLRIVGRIRTVAPALTYDNVLEATTATGTFPQLLTGSHRAEYDLDLRQLSDEGTNSYFSICARELDALTSRVDDGIRRDEITRLAVFAFARVPVLVHLGARLDDKVQTHIYQRHRDDTQNAWRWPSPSPEPARFSFNVKRPGTDDTRVALMVCLSGTVGLSDLPQSVAEAHIYELHPDQPSVPDPSIIDSPAALANFEGTCRRFLSHVEAAHGRLTHVDLFPAVPLSAAITLGRVLMPNVSPTWRVHDRDDTGTFAPALEVHR